MITEEWNCLRGSNQKSGTDDELTETHRTDALDPIIADVVSKAAVKELIYAERTERPSQSAGAKKNAFGLLPETDLRALGSIRSH